MVPSVWTKPVGVGRQAWPGADASINKPGPNCGGARSLVHVGAAGHQPEAQTASVVPVMGWGETEA